MGTIIPYRGEGRSRTPAENWHSDRMRARSALFDVYGDHLRSRGDQAPVSALIRLLEPVGIAAPAVRTAISRMSAQGWLEPTRVDAAPGYRATRRAIERLSEAASRIYRSEPEPWDGRWRLVFVDLPRERAPRARLREELHYLGYAEHAPGVWLCPFERPEVDEVVDRAGGRARHAVAVDLAPDPVEAWDLARLSTSYAAWPDLADALVRGETEQPGRRGRGGLRRPLPAGPRVAQVPLRRPRAPRGAAPARLAGPGGGGPVHQRGGAAQAGLRPVRGPLPGRVTAAVNSLLA